MSSVRSRTDSQGFLQQVAQRPPLLSPWALHPYGVLIGRVFNHPRLSDGKVIVTSTVVVMNEAEGWAQTRNTRYQLRDKRSCIDLKRIRREMRGE